MSRDDIRAESPDDGGYNHAHRAFLQAFLSRSVMTVDEIKPLLAAVMTAKDPNRPFLEGDITPPSISNFIQAINLRITPLDYEIRSARDQTTKTLTYALVNTTSDSFTQLATTFTPDEIAFVKRVLDKMFDENNKGGKEIMAVKQMEANQLAKVPRRARESQINGDGEEEGGSQIPDAKSVTMQQSDDILATLISQSFFKKSRKGYYSLAPRGLMELRSYLKETYNEDAGEENGVEEVKRIKDCEGCRDIVTEGLRCKRRECGVRWHDGCARQYFNAQRGAKKCPTCKEDWTGDFYVGERCVTGAARNSGVNGVASSSARGRGQDDEEEEEEE